jgi:hypothetical protein
MSEKVPTGFVKVRIDTQVKDGMAFVSPESTDPAEQGDWNTNAQFHARVIEGGTVVDALIKNGSEIAITATDELKKKAAEIETLRKNAREAIDAGEIIIRTLTEERDRRTEALRSLVQAVEIEVDDGRGGSGYLLARLFDAREALGLPAHRRSTDENGKPYIGGAL